FSKFLNELFTIQPAGLSSPLLLTVSSEIPVAISALDFRAGDLATLPLTSLSSPTPVPFLPLTSVTSSPAMPGFGIGQPVITESVGSIGSLIFAQVVTGGGWSTDITIGNTSAGIQGLQIDFFGSNGINTNSVTNILIPPRGVFFFTTAPAQTVNP